MNGVRDAGEGDFGNCRLDAGEDTNGDGVYGTVFPGGNKYLQFNAEYSVPVSDTVEFVFFYDAGNAFDDKQPIRLTKCAWTTVSSCVSSCRSSRRRCG